MPSTWGHLRRRLAQQFPGIPPGQLLGWLNEAYVAILGRRTWARARKNTVLALDAPYTTGTVALTAGVNEATGSATAWVEGMVGWSFQPGSQSERYTVSAVTSATTLTLDRVYEGETDSGLEYRMFHDLVAMPLGTNAVLSVSNPRLYPPTMKEITRSEMKSLYSQTCTSADEPQYWTIEVSLSEDEIDSDSDQIQRIRVAPYPDMACSLEAEISIGAYEVTEDRIGYRPIHFVTDTAIMEASRRLIFDNGPDAKPALAQRAERAFQLAMLDMEREDNGFIKPVPLKVPAHLFPTSESVGDPDEKEEFVWD